MRLSILIMASGALALSLTGQALAGAFEIGQAAAQSGDYANAARLWRPLAQNGDADAQYNLGVLYDQGLGVRRDPAQAVWLFHQAALGGVVDAEVNLGIHYAKGEGVPRDPVQADRWFRKAAAAGSQPARADLAMLHGQAAPQVAPETGAKAAAATARTSNVEAAEATPAFAPPPMDLAAAGAFATPSPQASLASPASASPHSPAASPRPSAAAPDASQAHWAQIGAFSNQRSAQQRWLEIQRRLPRETDGRYCRIERVAHGDATLFRALAGPFDSLAGAEAFCHKLSASSGECLPH